MDVVTLVRPPPEKRAKPSIGKTQNVAKSTAGKVVSAKSIGGKSGKSKSGLLKTGHGKSKVTCFC